MEKRFYIEELPESKWYLWDSWLSNLPHSTPFSTSWWLSTVCNLFGGSPHIFIIKTDKDEFIGGIGLREVKFLGKSIITPSPLSLYMPLVFSKDLSYNGGQGFISFTKNGKPTSFRISMWSNPVIVYGWISGSDPDYFRDGVSSFTVWSVLQYFKERGFKLFDWCGANIESIANFKLSFGANLTPIFVLRSEPLWFSIAHLLRGMTKEMIFRKRRKNNDNY